MTEYGLSVSTSTLPEVWFIEPSLSTLLTDGLVTSVLAVGATRSTADRLFQGDITE